MLGDGKAVISLPLYQPKLMLGAITTSLTHIFCISSEQSSCCTFLCARCTLANLHMNISVGKHWAT